MASADLVEFDTLTQPISDDAPTGSDIRAQGSANSLYYQIKDARNAARAAERNSLFDDEAASETLDQWRPILELAPRILSEESKDLEVCAWYTEALIRVYGFAGARDGFKLTHQLVKAYWDNLFPEPDEDGLETKVAALTGLNGEGGDGTLISPIKNVYLTEGNTGRPMAFWQYQQARDASKIADEDKRLEREQTLGFSMAAFEQEISQSSDAFCSDTRDDIDACIEYFKQLTSALDERCGYDAPPSSNILDTLEEVSAAYKFLVQDKLASLDASTPAEDSDAPATPDAAPTAAGAAVAVPAGAIASREAALKQLLTIADFFRKTEPHSPLASGIERLVKWGHMTLPELINELIPEDGARTTFAALTGVGNSEGADLSNVSIGESSSSAEAPAEKAEKSSGW